MAGTQRARRTVARPVALALTAVLSLALAACAPAETPTVDLPTQVDAALPDDMQAQLQSAVDAAVAASGSSGAVVGVWVPWAGTWLTAVGSTSPGAGAVGTDASFKAGNITRAMTCDVLYGLAADGTVSVDDPVTDYVTGLAGEQAMTLGELCDSTSGIASYAPLLSGRFTANPERVWDPRELVSYGTAAAMTGAPGAAYASSDTGYVLLGLALENASGSSAAELLDEYVFSAVGMPASTLSTTADVTLSGLWSGDNAEGGVACTEPRDVTDLSPSAGFTSSGVVSDLSDLGRYTQALATGARAYDTDARFDGALPAASDAPSWYTAKGGTLQAGTLIGQYGSIPGYLTAAFADRNNGMTVVVALNNSRASDTLVRSLAWQLAAIASKSPAASGATAPEAGLPWTAEDMAGQVAAAAVCPLP
ncbi:MAG TPA: serine hydrolase domain-containing protein [Microbacterium sp.]|nr:serine hydrolase domain-containing protein [Microbacterium sp.]